MNKLLIIPIVSLAIMIFQRSFNLTFSDTEIQTIVEGILSILVLLGIFADPKKKE